MGRKGRTGVDAGLARHGDAGAELPDYVHVSSSERSASATTDVSAAEQADAKAIARRLRTEDDARIRQGMEERQAGSTTQDLQRALYQR